MKISIAQRGGKVSLVTLVGQLEAGVATALEAKLPVLARQNVVFDCGGLDLITSTGMRDWIKFLNTLSETSSFEFINCSIPFMEFCNLLPTTAYASRIASLRVPFECDACKAIETQVFEVDALTDIKEFDLLVCPKCNGTMTSVISAFLHLGFLHPDE